MKRVEFSAEDGATLRGDLHQPEGAIRRPLPLVVLLHGLGSSRVEWYDFPAKLADKGYSVCAFDFRGHGQSDGPRGYQSVDRAFHDVESVIAGLEGEYGVDVDHAALVAHSLGAALALHFAMDLPSVRTLVAMAPPSRLVKEMNAFQFAGYFLADKINRPLSLLFRPGLRVPYKPAYERLYASRKAVERARRDDFLQPNQPVRNYQTLVKRLDAAKAARRLTKPTLVLVAERDAIVGPWNSRHVFGAIAAKSKQILTIPESGHSMAGDHRQDLVLEHTARWLAAHIRGDRP